ncbi:unnamed protein product [Closterium sp. Yama58-4]|nr:unnamed protein product [Closterium sp. Yama58-4]
MASVVVNPTQSTPPPNTGTASPVNATRVYLPDVDHEFGLPCGRRFYEAKAAVADQRCQATSDAIASVTSSGKRSRITDYLETDAAAGKCDAHEALALMFEACRIPERVAEHPLFINAVCDIGDAGTGYVPLKRTFIGGAGLRLCCENIDKGLSGTAWIAAWRPKPVVASILKPMVEVGLENMVAFCTDGGSNYAVACNELIAERPHIQHVPCATHVMYLFMEDIGKMPWAKKVEDPAGEISSFVRNHHLMRGYLRTPELLGIGRRLQRKFAAQVLDDAWWKTAEFFCKLMKLPFMAMRKTDGDAKGMMGRMYDMMLPLIEDVGIVVEEDEEQLSYSDKVHIHRLLKNRWDGSLACPMHVAGRIFHPANQDEDIFGSDTECTKVSKAFITQHAKHLSNHRKEWDDGDGIGEFLMELQEGNMSEPSVPEGYNVVEGDEEEEEGEDGDEYT